MLNGMLVRVGLLLVATGLTFILVGWLGVVGPFLMIVGSGCAAIAFENQLAHEAGASADLGAAAVDPSITGDPVVVGPDASAHGTNQAA